MKELNYNYIYFYYIQIKYYFNINSIYFISRPNQIHFHHLKKKIQNHIHLLNNLLLNGQ